MVASTMSDQNISMVMVPDQIYILLAHAWC